MIERLARIRMLVLEVDGVLTDGRVWQNKRGEWRRTFSVRDGMAIRACLKAGYQVVILTASQGEDIRQHVQSLKVTEFSEGVTDKASALSILLKRKALSIDEVLLFSDRFEDMACMREVGFAVTMPSAVAEMQSACHWVVESGGGEAAFLEIGNLVLQHGSQAQRDRVAAV